MTKIPMCADAIHFQSKFFFWYKVNDSISRIVTTILLNLNFSYLPRVSLNAYSYNKDGTVVIAARFVLFFQLRVVLFAQTTIIIVILINIIIIMCILFLLVVIFSCTVNLNA